MLFFRNLPQKDPSNIPDPYVKLYLLPDRAKETKRKTEVGQIFFSTLLFSLYNNCNYDLASQEIIIIILLQYYYCLFTY